MFAQYIINKIFGAARVTPVTVKCDFLFQSWIIFTSYIMFTSEKHQFMQQLSPNKNSFVYKFMCTCATFAAQEALCEKATSNAQEYFWITLRYKY